jgi:hypothetical protein
LGTTISQVVLKAILDVHLVKEGHGRDRERKEIEDYEQLCLKRIRREASRVKVEMLGFDDWSPALSKHVAEYILRRAVAREACEAIAKTLNEKKLSITAMDVEHFLAHVAKMEPKDYRREVLAELFKRGNGKPRGRRGRKPGLRNEVMRHLAWTEEGDRQRRARSWRSWTLDEIRFYLLTGMIPPNHYRVTNSLKSTSCFEFDEWRRRVDLGWYRRVSDELSHQGAAKEVEDLLADLLANAPLFVNKLVRKAKHGVPSTDYVRNMLAYHGYHRVRLIIGYEWRLVPENKTECESAGSSGKAGPCDPREG